MADFYDGTLAPKAKPDENSLANPPAQIPGPMWQDNTVMRDIDWQVVMDTSEQYDECKPIDMCQYGQDFAPLHVVLGKNAIPDGPGHNEVEEGE